ncbi:MAG: sulfur carrier protein ThiS [Gammaproteobacteria bacterium]|nr:sulfur carrier protein ThiS [Gammaproteobacteria bacterium]
MNITIHINDQPMDIKTGSSLMDAVIAFLGSSPSSSSGAVPPFALVLNQNFIPASEHATTALQENDRIEVISAIQGG